MFIVQWGVFFTATDCSRCSFPISFLDSVFSVTEAHLTYQNGDFKTCSIVNADKQGFSLNSSNNVYSGYVIAIGV